MKITVKQVSTIKSCPATINVKLERGDLLTKYKDVVSIIQQHDVKLLEEHEVIAFGEELFSFIRTPHAVIDALVNAGYEITR